MNEWYLFQGKGTRKEELNEQEIKKLRATIKGIDAPPWRQFGKVEDLIINNPDGDKTNNPDGDKTKDNQSIEEFAEKLDSKRFQKLIDLASSKDKEREIKKGKNFRLSDSDKAKKVRDAVNAAIYLRRPLLVTGNPGSGKTSLAYAIAYELNLGSVLSWSITARSTLQEGLYRYDAIARLQDANNPKIEEQPIGKYITLGALGTAFLPSYLPRVLLIDEIDKSDINLPNDLLNLFEEGQFKIPELVRQSKKNGEGEKDNLFKVETQDEDLDVFIKGGRVRCYAFPIIIMTSNRERDFPQPFKRRCLRVNMPDPDPDELRTIVKAHFGAKLFKDKEAEINELIKYFLPETGGERNKATDQLLNAIYVITHEPSPQDEEQKKAIRRLLMKPLTESE